MHTINFDIKKYTYSSMTLIEFIESAGGASIVTKVISWFTKWLALKNKSKPAEGIKAIVEVYGEMDWILTNSSLNKAHIYFLEDSGKIPNVAIPQYLTCTYESYSPPLISNRDDLQKFLVDKSFISAFNVACDEGVCIIAEANPFDTSSKMRDMMLQQKMKHSEIYLIAQTEVKSFYIGLSSTTRTYDQMDEIEKINTRAGVDRIRGIFKRAIKYLK